MPNPSRRRGAAGKARRRPAPLVPFSDTEQYQVIRVQTPDAVLVETLSALPVPWRVFVRQLVAVLGLLLSTGHLLPGSSAIPEALRETLGHLLPFLHAAVPPVKPGR